MKNKKGGGDKTIEKPPQKQYEKQEKKDLQKGFLPHRKSGGSTWFGETSPTYEYTYVRVGSLPHTGHGSTYGTRYQVHCSFTTLWYIINSSTVYMISWRVCETRTVRVVRCVEHTIEMLPITRRTHDMGGVLVI